MPPPRCRRTARRSPIATHAPYAVAILLALPFASACPHPGSQRVRAQAMLSKVRIIELDREVNLFRFDTDRYPTAAEGLAALLQPPAGLARWNGPYVRDASHLVDAWGRAFQYRTDGSGFVITSLGADGAPGGTGVDADITNAPHDD